MAYADEFLPEFDHEMQTTRALLERTPLANAGFKPHAKSRTLGALASHIANLPGYGAFVVNQSDVDFAPGGTPRTPVEYHSTDELLAAFDSNVATTRAAIAKMPDSALRDPWSLKRAGTPIFTLPRVAALRTFMMYHMIHHRGQLSVYLRQNDVPLPSIYGPTADS
jgi:uncharacterized damage-inducible protein DinB